MPNVDDILGGARDAITVRRVFGDPVERDGATIVPVAAVRGGGGGGGDARGDGGAGFGLSATPAGAYVIRDGRVAWRPAVNVNRIVLGGQVLAALAMVLAFRLRRR